MFGRQRRSSRFAVRREICCAVVSVWWRISAAPSARHPCRTSGLEKLKLRQERHILESKITRQTALSHKVARFLPEIHLAQSDSDTGSNGSINTFPSTRRDRRCASASAVWSSG